MEYTVAIELETVECTGCGGTYAISKTYVATRRSDGDSWHCPYCDGSFFFRDCEEDRLRKVLAAERASHDQTKAAAAEWKMKADAEKKKADKAAKKIRRTHAGLCTECNRQFDDLHDHMRHEHGTAASRAACVAEHKKKA